MKQILDLSRHNGIIDFVKVREAGYKDVILQIGWIGNHNNHTLDKNFEMYYNQAKFYGFNIGIYVFTYCKTLEALQSGIKWVINNLKNKSINLPVFLDVEDDPDSNSYLYKLGKENLTNQCLMFCKEIENAGYKAGIYANKNFFDNYIDITQLLNYTIWWAEYNSQIHNTHKVDLWQYTSKGQVNGILGNVDISYCYTDFEDKKPDENQNINNGDEEEVKRYVNGTTPEDIFADTNLTVKVGTLFPHGECECLGVFENRAILRYPIYNGNNIVNYKIGFAKWLDGIQN